MSDRVEIAPGVEMPLLGLGVWEVPDGAPVERAVGWALEAGYRHFDTAQGYGNEAGVGRAIRRGGLPREKVFVTTKFDTSRQDPELELERSLERLGTDYVDLYLVHNPRGGATRAWPAMERVFERGLASAIGVSNFGVTELGKLLRSARTLPAVDQVQFSPFQYRRGLLATCRDSGIVLEAYSPLTRGRDLGNPVVVGIADRCGHTPAQVLIRWALQRGAVVIPKSAHRERIRENAAAFDFTLAESDMTALDALDRTHGTGRALEREWWTYRGRARRVARAAIGRLRGSG